MEFHTYAILIGLAACCLGISLVLQLLNGWKPEANANASIKNVKATSFMHWIAMLAIIAAVVAAKEETTDELLHRPIRLELKLSGELMLLDIEDLYDFHYEDEEEDEDEGPPAPLVLRLNEIKGKRVRR
jgi:hypothetical protein